MRATVCVHQNHKSFIRLIICRLCSVSFACISSDDFECCEDGKFIANSKFRGFSLPFARFFSSSCHHLRRIECVCGRMRRRFPLVFSTEHTLTNDDVVHCSAFCSKCFRWFYLYAEHHVIIVQSLVALPSRLAINYNAPHCDKLHLFCCSALFCPRSIEEKDKIRSTRHCSIFNHLDDSLHMIYSFMLCQSKAGNRQAE